MKTKYTKGPWEFKAANDGIQAFRIAGDGLIIADAWKQIQMSVGGHSHAPVEEQARANAQLIASAPELLESLKGMVAAYIDRKPDDAPDWTERKMAALSYAQHIIAQAEGAAQ